MATPYLQLRRDTVPSTQDVAREKLEDLPVLVMSPIQTKGRGRAGDEWINADRALAVSVALHSDRADSRPFSLMAGVAAARVAEGTTLKWPNDVLLEGVKVGGILVERSGDVLVIGLGLNLWWPRPPEGMGALLDEDPGEDHYAEVGGRWGAELMRLLDTDGWPRKEYRRLCLTLGKEISWQPDGAGRAVDIADDGALVVEKADGARETLYSAVVSHVEAR